MKIFGFLAFISLSLISWNQTSAEESRDAKTESIAEIQTVKKQSFLTLGMGVQMIKSSDASAQTASIDLNLRSHLEPSRFSYQGALSLLFRSNASLFGILGSAGAGYRIFGQEELKKELHDSSHTYLAYTRERSPFTAWIDLSLSGMPVFGENATSVYSGPSLGISLLKSTGLNFYSSLKVHSLFLGSRTLQVINLCLTFPVGQP